MMVRNLEDVIVLLNNQQKQINELKKTVETLEYDNGELWKRLTQVKK